MIFIKRKLLIGSFLLLSAISFTNTVKTTKTTPNTTTNNSEKTITFTSFVSVDEIEIEKAVNGILRVFGSESFIQEFSNLMGEYDNNFTANENTLFSNFTRELMKRFLEKRKYSLKNVVVNKNQAVAKVMVREPDFSMYKKEHDDALKKLEKKYENAVISENEMTRIYVDEVTKIHMNILNKKDLKYKEVPVDIKFIKINGTWIIDEASSEKTSEELMGVDRIIYLLQK